ncbi:MAG: hypothetical protein Q9227_004382 [Pyrenula ochraceoflavens]
MFVPPASQLWLVPRSTAYSILPNGGSSQDKLQEWSSFIGIVTAIVGNILISFALNIQRYAHIRIEREHNEAYPGWKKGSKSKSLSGSEYQSYGTVQPGGETGERRRVNFNTSSPDSKGGLTNGNGSNNRQSSPQDDSEPDETEPLKGSFQSDRTLALSDKDIEADRKSYLRSPYWWCGIILMTIGEAGNFLAYGFAPASIVSPLGVVALVSNCLIAPLMLKERFRARDFFGVVVAIAGAVVVVLSAKSSESKMGPHMLWDNIKRWEFLVYVLVTLAAIGGLAWASGKYGEKSILIDLGLVALFGGYTALSTKAVASLLSDTLWRTLTFPITYICVLVLVASALLQIRYINRALQRFDSTQVIPTQFVLFTISVILGSAVLYRDFESATADRVGKFVGGCALTFAGVYLITSHRAQGNDDESDTSSTSGEQIRLIDEEAAEGQPRLSRLRTADAFNKARLQANDTNTPKFEGRRKRSPQPLVTSPPNERPSSSPKKPPTRAPRRKSTASSVSGASYTSTPPTSSPNPDSAGAVPPSAPIIDTTSSTPAFTSNNPWLSSTERLVDTPLSHHPNHSNLPTPYRPGFRSAPRTPNPRAGPIRSAVSSLDVHPSTPPSHSQTLAPNTPFPPVFLRRASGPADPETPPQPSPKALDPSSATPPPPRLVGRGSFSRLMPGPLLSPLSAGLSAVVADAVRKGEGLPTNPNTPQRRKRSRSPRRRDSGYFQPAENAETSEEALSRVQTREAETTTADVQEAMRGRARGPAQGRVVWMGDGEVQDVMADDELDTKEKKGRLKSMSQSLGTLIGRGTRGRRRDRVGESRGRRKGPQRVERRDEEEG